MSYEYKKQIKDDLKALHEVRKFAEWRAVEMNIDAKCAELDHVYAQTAKANEYEAKAKAWDLLKLKLDGKNKSILRNPKASDEDLDFVGNNTAVLWEMSDLEMKFRKEQESGESDA